MRPAPVTVRTRTTASERKGTYVDVVGADVTGGGRHEHLTGRLPSH